MIKRYYVDAVFDNPHPQSFVQEAVVFDSDYIALEIQCRAALLDRNDECRLRQGAEQQYAKGLERIAAIDELYGASKAQVSVSVERIADLEARCRAVETDRDSWRRLAERYETNCTGRHGSQQSCGNFPTSSETKDV